MESFPELFSPKYKPLQHINNISDIKNNNISEITLPCAPSQQRNGNDCTSMHVVNKCFEQLRIETQSDENNLGELKNGLCAGKINNIIFASNIAIIKPDSCHILYLGTPLFVKLTNFEKLSRNNHMLLGYIDDIFGSIQEPMYAITILCNSRKVLNIGEEVYYFPKDPNTQFMYTERRAGSTFNKVRYSVKTRNP